MTWKLTSFGERFQPLPHVPWRDLSDEEFALAEGRYPELRERRYFEQVIEPARGRGGEGAIGGQPAPTVGRGYHPRPARQEAPVVAVGEDSGASASEEPPAAPEEE
jgi:hypothetical protein